MPKITPGPWVVGGTDYRIRGDDGSPIADVLQWSHPLQQKANAYLIAAAPEMYAALVSIRKTLIESGGDPMPTLDAVIAKAEAH